jgi:ribosome-associated protein
VRHGAAVKAWEHPYLPVRGPVGVSIREESIRLGQFLKLADFVEAGSDAKELIRAGEVLVNGEPETRPGRQLRAGDVVELDGRSARVAGGRDRLSSEQVIMNGGDSSGLAVQLSTSPPPPMASTMQAATDIASTSHGTPGNRTTCRPRARSARRSA